MYTMDYLKYGRSGSKCIISSCMNYKNQKDKKVFHRFPSNKIQCQKWLDYLNNEHLRSTFTDDKGIKTKIPCVRICEDHFERNDYINPELKSKGLRKNAVPSKNLTCLLINVNANATCTAEDVVRNKHFEPECVMITNELESEVQFEPESHSLSDITDPLSDSVTEVLFEQGIHSLSDVTVRDPLTNTVTKVQFEPEIHSLSDITDPLTDTVTDPLV
ncbi:uncharacterized protein LOC135849896 isoform X2 [Planococcus citri]|uniref:uncharacterized protein LOC135849896 isoform X2 n=1 Tax=Planococcus citri TaxID=170843 RepID=UPI0031F8A549